MLACYHGWASGAGFPSSRWKTDQEDVSVNAVSQYLVAYRLTKWVGVQGKMEHMLAGPASRRAGYLANFPSCLVLGLLAKVCGDAGTGQTGASAESNNH